MHYPIYVISFRDNPANFRIVAGAHSKSLLELTGNEVIAEIESFHPVSGLQFFRSLCLKKKLVICMKVMMLTLEVSVFKKI